MSRDNVDRFKAIQIMADELDAVRNQIVEIAQRRSEVHQQYIQDMSILSKREEVLIHKEAIAQDAITKFALGEAHTYSK